MNIYDKGRFGAPCPKCEGILISYASQFLVLEDDYLVMFKHQQGEEECDGYLQIRTEDFDDFEVLDN